MDVGIAQFWGGIAVIALSSVVNIIITFYNTSKASENFEKHIDANSNNVDKQIKANNSNFEANIKASMVSLATTIEANINSVEKELKTKIGVEVLSKYRQEWINDLRKQVSKFISIASKMPLNIVSTKINDADLKPLVDNEMTELTIIRDYLLLLLNREEGKSKKINKSISDIMFHISYIKNMNKDELANHAEYNINKTITLVDELIQNTQDVLKAEWERVKKGV